MRAGAVIAGSAESTLIVCTPEPGILNLIWFRPALPLAALIASRRVHPFVLAVHAPSLVSAVELTVKVDAAAATQGENSEVFPSGSVAVAVRYEPGNTPIGIC